VRKFGLLVGVLIGVAVFEQPSSAQSGFYAFFERTLETLRVEAAVPAMSAAIVQDGVIAWSAGLGRQDVEGNIPARADTPYVIGTLSQTLGSALLLRKCVDQSHLEVTDRVVRWRPEYPEPNTTIGELLSHTAPDGTFKYAPGRQEVLTSVLEECAHSKYVQLLGQEIFDLLAMINSVPGQALRAPTADDAAMFEPARLVRYGDVLRRLAVPYRVINRRPIRNIDVASSRAGFADGVVSTVLDLAQFDLAYDNGLLAPLTRIQALSQTNATGKTGLGWFVQAYNGEPIAWQFGLVEGAYSSLIVKVPNRRLTLILLANSDGLSVPFSLEAGDVTTSIFARTFLRTFLP
jgi:CubicO group peptidase (beta-lactamase class C family)